MGFSMGFFGYVPGCLNPAADWMSSSHSCNFHTDISSRYLQLASFNEPRKCRYVYYVFFAVVMCAWIYIILSTVLVDKGRTKKLAGKVFYVSFIRMFASSHG